MGAQLTSSEITQFASGLGRVLVAARALLGWSQAELESRSGVARKTISDFEQGRRALGQRTRTDLFATIADFGVGFKVDEQGRLWIALDEPAPLTAP